MRWRGIENLLWGLECGYWISEGNKFIVRIIFDRIKICCRQIIGNYADRSVQNVLQRSVILSKLDENTTVRTNNHSYVTHLNLYEEDV